MSLINQMLKDLEQRTKFKKHATDSLSGLNASAVSKWNYTKKNKKFFLTSVVLSSLVFFLILKLYSLHHVTNVKQSIYPLQIAPVLQENIKNNNHGILDNFHATATAVTGLTLQVQKDKTLLRVLLSQDTTYRISKGKDDNYYIVLDHAKLFTNLPAINTVNSAIANIQMQNGKNENLYIMLTPKQGAELNHLELIDSGKYPELQIDFLYKEKNDIPAIATENAAVTPSETLGTLTKSLVSLGPEEEYQQAIQYSAQGNNDKAITILNHLMTQFPDYSLARESLVTLLLQQGKETQANNILQIGLRQHPSYAPYAKLKAKILVDEGKISDAINILQSSAPNIQSNPEYHAFIAALYQRQGDSMLAAKLYEQLLPLEPDNAIWWMGLGIAYENLGKHNEALQAYARADNDKLNPELKAYVESRMHNLQ